MKSTYKLFGTYWDGMPSADMSEIKLIENPEVFKGCNSLSLKALFSVNNASDFDKTTQSIDPDIPVVLSIDYSSSKENPILNTFNNKRISQIIWRIQETFSEVYYTKA